MMDKVLYVVSFRNNLMYIEVEAENCHDVIQLSRYGVDVRLGTSADRKQIDFEEMDMEAWEDDLIRDWEDDEGAITLTIKDWE